MIDVTIYQRNQDYVGFEMTGHAGFAEYGRDIVCAAVSVLVFNTINSVEAFTEDEFRHEMEEERGSMFFLLTQDYISDASGLLLRSLVLGLQGIETSYGRKHITIHFQEIKEV